MRRSDEAYMDWARSYRHNGLGFPFEAGYEAGHAAALREAIGAVTTLDAAEKPGDATEAMRIRVIREAVSAIEALLAQGPEAPLPS
jgi:hypothetical protein